MSHKSVRFPVFMVCKYPMLFILKIWLIHYGYLEEILTHFYEFVLWKTMNITGMTGNY